MREPDETMKQLQDQVREELKELTLRPPMAVEFPQELAFMVVSQLQLAFRHPSNTGPTRRVVEEFAQQLRGRICAPGSALDVVIQMGADERPDR